MAELHTGIIEGHLIPALGAQRLDSIDVADLERYLSAKRRQGYAARTLNRQLNLLHSLFKAAERRRLVQTNPVSAVERPAEPRASRRASSF